MSKNAQAESNVRQACLVGIAEAQPLFCKEHYIVSSGSTDCLCLYIFYVLTDRKKKAACLLRVFAKGRRNNGVLYVLSMGLCFPQWFFLPVCREAHSLDYCLRFVVEQCDDFFLEIAFRVNALFQICQATELGIKFDGT